ncbi:Xaa-Pro aminopeptidase [Pseudoalteromonas tunicata]|jgi:Xaa-Pro aminopeptidase|uniref:Xaa-Pro aminopeptidase n=1 Tax=Pseudoalteromonas tunicata D2 TaxID=87626 RepID=A4CCL8_9GAMM|nr:Xaa-Pro aminopeptidase [Pseudoalteromonas tunicata]ATC93812.1 Xaa-Pro aminopeptidase [Pseudoalteromonas tunicata]AXT29631.1 Xaa-Pro aminopeptidase [Pseudoalteromonas tunicata]EAR27311.1 proline aminopeptidase P II [Pseudoalteromonas tunicata D2]MDP4982951.1 Xaa-Pro aminopeptidase [Pseudoalteromonas tunicata]
MSEFIQRRARLLASMEPNSIAIIGAAKEKTRSRDTEYAFRQDSDFFYLTGFNEPDAVLVLAPDLAEPCTLFCRAKDKMAEIWSGRRLGPEQAQIQLGFNHADSLDGLEDKLLALINGHPTLYFAQGNDGQFDDLIWQCINTLRNGPKRGFKAPHTIKDVRSLVHEMRLFKSDAELALMQEAANISSKAHIRAMQFAKAGATEYQLEAEIHHHYAMNGARHPAYGTIVGSGDNANILHYTENSSVLVDGDLVLIDSGCELQGYAADITRTFPVNGRFSAPQKQLYQLVLDAQLAALEVVKPGNTLKMVGDAAINVLTQGMISLGLLQGDLDELISKQAYKAFYMHGVGHWLGLDVHDVGDYKQDEKDRPFEPGMVLTVEPGLYVAADAIAPEQFKGIGIRIEDDVVVTQTGHIVLTALVPKTIAEIEAIMQAGV